MTKFNNLPLPMCSIKFMPYVKFSKIALGMYNIDIIMLPFLSLAAH